MEELLQSLARMSGSIGLLVQRVLINLIYFFFVITVLYLQGVFLVLAKNIKFFSCPFSFTKRVLPETAPKTRQIKIKFETPQAFFEEGKIYFKHCSFSGFSH